MNSVTCTYPKNSHGLTHGIRVRLGELAEVAVVALLVGESDLHILGEASAEEAQLGLGGAVYGGHALIVVFHVFFRTVDPHPGDSYRTLIIIATVSSDTVKKKVENPSNNETIKIRLPIFCFKISRSSRSKPNAN